MPSNTITLDDLSRVSDWADKAGAPMWKTMAPDQGIDPAEPGWTFRRVCVTQEEDSHKDSIEEFALFVDNHGNWHVGVKDLLTSSYDPVYYHLILVDPRDTADVLRHFTLDDLQAGVKKIATTLAVEQPSWKRR